jgi:predicted transcriptional regulator
LGLNDLEANVLSYLIKHSHTGTSELTEFFKVDRSSIQRVLQKLGELNLIKRESMSLKAYEKMKGFTHSNKRGYLYVYSARDVKSIKIQFKTLLDKWYGSMLNYIEHLDSLFDCFETDGELCF